MRTFWVWSIALSLCMGCRDSGEAGSPPDLGAYRLERRYPTSEVREPATVGCTYASPLLFEGRNGPRLIVSDSAGTVRAIVPSSGSVDWWLLLPAPDGEHPYVLGTPVVVGTWLVVAYFTVQGEPGDPAEPRANPLGPRVRHRMAVIDLDRGILDANFPVLDLEAEVLAHDGGVVPFLPAHAASRSTLVHARPAASTLGVAYVTFGNIQDIQPWHGWAFEVDLDRWLADGSAAAVTAVLVTTPEADCGPTGLSGSRERICGGGLWAPSGPLLIERDGTYDLILAPGNGQLDLGRRDYANTLMRTGPGLAFEPGCDPDACANFDPDAPALACAQSCSNLFIPRLLPGQTPPVPANGSCDGLTLFECWQALDYIGGSTPVRVTTGDFDLLAYPTKDGHVYLVDALHLGTLYDRVQVVELCGAPGDPCKADWAGMMVTQPVVAEVDGTTILVTPAFMPDDTHPAGVVAFDVAVEDASPKLVRRWEFPRFDTPAAKQRFRWHPSRMAVVDLDGEGPVGILVEPGNPGRLYGIRLRDGQSVFQHDLVGPGIRYVLPIVHDGTIFVPSCDRQTGPGVIEAYSILSDARPLRNNNPNLSSKANVNRF